MSRLSSFKLHPTHTLAALHSPGLLRRLESASDGELREGRPSRSRRAGSVLLSDPPLFALSTLTTPATTAAPLHFSDVESSRPRRSPLISPSSHQTTAAYAEEEEEKLSAMEPLLLSSHSSSLRASSSPSNGETAVVSAPSPAATAPVSRPWQFALLAALAIRNSAMTLTVHHSRAVLKEPYSTLTTILSAELLKLLLCAVLMLHERHYDALVVLSRLRHITLSSMHMSVPAVLYLAQNQLNYIALRVLPSAQYALVQQLKLLTTAVFCVVLLQKRIAAYQWRALVLLLLGVILIQTSASSLHASSRTLQAAKQNWWQSLTQVPLEAYFGLLAALLQTILCGLSGAYTEWRLKGDRSCALWEQNWQLALHSLLFGLIALAGSDGDRRSVAQHGFFHGYSAWTALCIALNGLGGLLVSGILLYMDNILKNFSGTAAILLTSCVSYLLFDEDIFSTDFMVGTAIIVLAMLTYTGGTGQAEAGQSNAKADMTAPANDHTLGNGSSDSGRVRLKALW